MQATLHRLFLSHPQTVDESYGEHFVFALGFALRLFGAGLAALVHAIIPCLFEATASRMILSHNPAAKIVMLSGYLSPDDISAMGCGAVAGLAKPLRGERLKKLLDEMGHTPSN